MSILPHTLAGAVAGSFFQNPYVAAAAGFSSHLLLDYIPHFDPEMRKKVSRWQKRFYLFVIVIDLFLSGVVLLFLYQHPNLFWGALLGIIPDIDNFLQFKFKNFPLLSKIGIKTHDLESTTWHRQTNFILGFINQLAVTILCAVYLLSLYAGTS